MDQAAEDNEPAKSHCSSHNALNTPLFANIAHILHQTTKHSTFCHKSGGRPQLAVDGRHRFEALEQNHKITLEITGCWISCLILWSWGRGKTILERGAELAGWLLQSENNFFRNIRIELIKEKEEKWLGGWPLSEISHKWDYCCKSWPPGGKIAAKFDARHY